jgi:hypothetical protein
MYWGGGAPTVRFAPVVPWAKAGSAHVTFQLITNSRVRDHRKGLLQPRPAATVRPSRHVYRLRAAPPPKACPASHLLLDPLRNPNKHAYGNWALMSKYFLYRLCLKSGQPLCLICSDQDSSEILTFIEVQS